jgi:hypothetical protein
MKFYGTFRGQFEFEADDRYKADDIIRDIEKCLNDEGFELKMIDVNQESEPYDSWHDPDTLNDERKLEIE